MKHRWEFFKESDSSFGLFYPKNYLVAGFDTYERACEVAKEFLSAGFAEEDVAATTGHFMMRTVESQKGASWFDRLWADLATAAGTEAGYIEDDMKLARHGGAFLFVYVPDKTCVERARELLKRLHPIYARRYHAMAIERLSYPTQAAL